MARHHQMIVDAAAKMLRRRGIDGMSVADLMQDVGLTHGGFYRHFVSKEALVVEAMTATFDEMIRRLEPQDVTTSASAALDAYVSVYLSMGHVEHPELGCPIAAYGTDVARESDAIRQAYTAALERLLATIAKGLPCSSAKRRARASELFSLICGAVVTARASGETALARSILATARRRAAELQTACE